MKRYIALYKFTEKEEDEFILDPLCFGDGDSITIYKNKSDLINEIPLDTEFSFIIIELSKAQVIDSILNDKGFLSIDNHKSPWDNLNIVWKTKPGKK